MNTEVNNDKAQLRELDPLECDEEDSRGDFEEPVALTEAVKLG